MGKTVSSIRAFVPIVLHVVTHFTLQYRVVEMGKGLALVFLEWQQNAPKLFVPRNRFSYCQMRIHSNTVSKLRPYFKFFKLKRE